MHNYLQYLIHQWWFQSILPLVLTLKSRRFYRLKGKVTIYRISGDKFKPSFFLRLLNECLKNVYHQTFRDRSFKFLSAFTNTMFKPDPGLGEEREVWLITKHGLESGCFAFRFFETPFGKLAYINAQMIHPVLRNKGLGQYVVKQMLSAHPDVHFVFSDATDPAAIGSLFTLTNYDLSYCLPTHLNSKRDLVQAYLWLLDHVVDPFTFQLKNWVDRDKAINYHTAGPKPTHVEPNGVIEGIFHTIGFTSEMATSGKSVIHGIKVR